MFACFIRGSYGAVFSREDSIAADKIFGFEGLAIGGQDEFRFRAGCRRAVPQRGKGLRHLSARRDRDMDIAGLQNAAQIGFVGRTAAQFLQGGCLVSECLQEGIGKLGRVT